MKEATETQITYRMINKGMTESEARALGGERLNRNGNSLWSREKRYKKALSDIRGILEKYPNDPKVDRLKMKIGQILTSALETEPKERGQK